MYKTIYVKTTGTCNLDCKHCFTNGKTGDKTQFDPVTTGDWIESFMSEYSEDTHHHIELHGGEPFLVPLKKLKAFAERFTHLNNVSMCSNSNLTFRITSELVDFIKTHLGSHIGTSWDHWIRWTSVKQFELWKANLVKLRAADITVALKVSMSKPMVASSPDWFLDQMDALAIDEISLERLTLSGNAVENMDIFPDNDQQDEWYLALYKRYKERKPSYKIKTLDILEEKISLGLVKVDTNCRNCEQNLVTINSDGSLGGCPNVATTHSHALITQPVQEFLVSDGRVNEIATELTWHDNCLACDVFDLCGGDCHRLPWQDGRCGGLKKTLRFLSGRETQSNIIFRG